MLNQQDTDQVWEVQRWLAMRGLYQERVDGLYGNQTEAAIDQFKKLENITTDDWLPVLMRRVDEMQPGRMSNEDEFLYELKKMCQHLNLNLPQQWAYIAATVKHETAGAFRPVEEGFYLKGDDAVRRHQRSLRYFPYFARGFVGLTWEENYRFYTTILRSVHAYGKPGGIDLVADPDQAQDPAIALFILVHGFKLGTFRNNHFIERYINEREVDFIHARLCINGYPKGSAEPDKASLIAGYAKKYLEVMQ